MAQKRPIWTWLCSVSPWLVLFLYMAMAAHVRLGLGHWPRPYLEGYHSLAFTIHQTFVVFVFLFAIYLAGPLWLVFLFWRELRLSLPQHILQVVAYGSGCLAIHLASRYDPTTFTDWFFD